MDRVDIHAEVPRVDYDKLSDDQLGEPSEAIRQRVEAARGMQRARFEGKGLTCNANMGVAEVREFCGVGSESRRLLRAVQQQLGMSTHSYRCILSVPKGASSIWSGERPRPLFLPPRLLQSADSDAHSALPSAR